MITINKFCRLYPRIQYFSLQALDGRQQKLCYPSKKLYSIKNNGLNNNGISTEGKLVHKPLRLKLQSPLAKNRMNQGSAVVAGDSNKSDKKQTKAVRQSFPQIKKSCPWMKKNRISFLQSQSQSQSISCLRPSKAVKEHGIVISVSENPPRSSDGTSSGAIAADRLRMARRKALQSMTSSNDNIPTAKPLDNKTDNDNLDTTNINQDRKGRMFVIPNENPPRSSDGTSSGAVAADRLRMARRKALQSMASSNDNILTANPLDVTPPNDNPNATTRTKARMGGMLVIPNENPPRSSDGTSSGAIVADRLRMARRKMLQSMVSSEDQNSNIK